MKGTLGKIYYGYRQALLYFEGYDGSKTSPNPC
jgi:hypothetical protein